MSAFPDDRRDLAAMFVPLARALVAREEPALQAHDISMWGYVVLTALAEQPVRTQAALAQAISADKSRIIGVLDDLQERGLIQRQPDTADRRVHLLSLTPAGRPAAAIRGGRDPRQRAGRPRDPAARRPRGVPAVTEGPVRALPGAMKDSPRR